MNYLGIDLGNKRCGLAYTLEGIIFTLPGVERFRLVNEIKKIINEKNIGKIIVGLPYDLYGTDHTQLDRTTKFIEKLKNILPNIEVEGIDERFTTFESINILSQFENPKNIKEKKDSMSAFLILETYLGKNKNSL